MTVMTKEQQALMNKSLLMIYASFPRIGKALELYWGEKEFATYINKLTAVDRPGRQGFPSLVMEAIAALQILHDEVFPNHAYEDPDDWTSSMFGNSRFN
jgi:hypothetical protein